MPQSPTPNMNLVKPTEQGDSGTWASILDALFDLVDSHDHSTGKGVKISMFNGVTIAADIPWNSGGVFYAITNLKAIDFQPSSQAAVAGFQGALFVDSLDNELKYRTTGGALIKFTNGPNFNFSATGQIGGDYSNVAALVDYVDVNGLYRMRQELAGGSQQFALVQTGGVDLYEFKLHPAAGVPTQHVRLASPAGLASNYTVTWPGALPAAKVFLQIDNTGQVATGPAALPSQAELVSIDAAGAVTAAGKHGQRTIQLPIQWPSNGADPWKFGTIAGSFATFDIPIPLHNGDRILAVRLRLKDSVTGPTKLTIGLSSVVDGVASVVATSAQSAGSGAAQTIAASGLTTTIASGTNYQAHVNTATGSTNCSIYWIEIDYDRP